MSADRTPIGLRLRVPSRDRSVAQFGAVQGEGRVTPRTSSSRPLPSRTGLTGPPRPAGSRSRLRRCDHRRHRPHRPSCALAILRDEGLLVPKDVAVRGFDNWNLLVREPRPPLRNVTWSPRLSAAHRLVDVIGGTASTGVSPQPDRVVTRTSTGILQATLRRTGCGVDAFP